MSSKRRGSVGFRMARGRKGGVRNKSGCSRRKDKATKKGDRVSSPCPQSVLRLEFLAGLNRVTPKWAYTEQR